MARAFHADAAISPRGRRQERADAAFARPARADADAVVVVSIRMIIYA